MSKLVKREGILAKIESPPGTDAAPVAANDSVMVENVAWSFAGARMTERNPVRATLGKLPPIFGGTLMEVSFDVELKGSGTAGTPPEADPLFRASACGVTNVVATSDTYADASSSLEYATIWFYEDGSLYKMTGCQGTWDLNAEVGGPGKVSFTFTGHLTGPIDATLPMFVFDATVPPPFLSAGFTTGGFSSDINALQFSIGNEVVTPPSANSADGYGLIHIADRDMGGSFDPEATLIADDDPIGDWKAGTQKAITTAVIGSTAGNRWQLVLSSSYYREIGPGDRDGIRTLELGFMSTALSLAFT